MNSGEPDMTPRARVADIIVVLKEIETALELINTMTKASAEFHALYDRFVWLQDDQAKPVSGPDRELLFELINAHHALWHVLGTSPISKISMAPVSTLRRISKS